MRVIVISDSHGNFFKLKEIVDQHKNADVFIHLGDGYKEWSDIEDLYPNLKFISVCGNCDYASMKPSLKIISLNQAKIFCTHGHLYHAKYSNEELIKAAKDQNCNVVLYGHTHIAESDFIDGVYIFNPGSITSPKLSNPSYGILDITEQSIIPIVVELK